MLFNEPKLLKSTTTGHDYQSASGFSALQRAEIAEIVLADAPERYGMRFSALQRAEIAEINADLRSERLLDEFQCSSTSRNC